MWHNRAIPSTLCASSTHLHGITSKLHQNCQKKEHEVAERDSVQMCFAKFVGQRGSESSSTLVRS